MLEIYTMKEVSNEWLSLVKKSLEKANLLPVLNEVFPFPWNEASQAIASALSLNHLSLSPTRATWRPQEKFLHTMGDDPFIFALDLSPIEGSFFFIMSQQDVAYLTSETVALGEEGGFLTPILQKGFYQFILLKVIKALNDLKSFKEISIHLTSLKELPEEMGFCIDTCCALAHKALHGRVVCPQSFLNAFQAYGPLEKQSLLSLDQKVELTLRAEVGKTSLVLQDWEKVELGDFIILDQHSYSPKEKKGSTVLVLAEIPLLIARIKEEGIKILDYLFFPKEEPPISDASIMLTAEIGRVQLTLHQLLHLVPNQLLHGFSHVEQGVELFSGNQLMGKGELLQLGDTVGFRILTLGPE